MFFRTSSIAKPFINCVEVSSVDTLHDVNIRKLLSNNGVVVLNFSPSVQPATLPPLTQFIPAACHVDTNLPSVTTPRPPCTFPPTTSGETPTFGALHNCGNAVAEVSFARFETVFSKLSSFHVSQLHTQRVSISDPVTGKSWMANLADSPTRARLPISEMTVVPSNLIKEDRNVFHCVVSDVHSLAADECTLPRNTVQLLPGSLIVFDNTRYAHMIKKCDATELKQMSFDTPNNPALDEVLFNAAEYPLFRKSAPADDMRLDLSTWPAVSQKDLIKRVNEHFGAEFYSKPGFYWGKINRTTVEKIEMFGMCDALPADLREIVTQREFARQVYIDAGIIRQNDLMGNLFETHKCARSLELRTHICSSVDVASFPLGAQMDDDELFGMMAHYGMSIMAGPMSKLMQFAIFCLRAGYTFPKLRAALYTNDLCGQEDLRPLKRLVASDDQKMECYGTIESDYGGSFALSRADSSRYRGLEDVSKLHVVDEKGRDVLVGEVGELAVTSLIRRKVPMLKVREGLIVRRVSEEEVEYLGEPREATFYDFSESGKRVFWEDVMGSVGRYLKNTFAGCVLFQVLIKSGSVTVAVYADNSQDGEDYEQIEGEIRKRCEEVLSGCGVTSLRVKWLKYGHELKHMPSFRLKTFVDDE